MKRLEFAFVRACRCSFVIRIDGKEAFVSNHNLMVMMQNPTVEYKIKDVVDPHGNHRLWVWIKEATWTSGIDFRNFRH